MGRTKKTEEVLDFVVDETATEDETPKTHAGGIKTDEGGRPVMDDGGRPVMEQS